MQEIPNTEFRIMITKSSINGQDLTGANGGLLKD